MIMPQRDTSLRHCPHWPDCGGCPWQGRAYAEQVAAKQALVTEGLARFGVTPRPMLEAPDIWFYRNKMEFVFGGTAGAPLLGLHKAGSYRHVVNITECLLMSERCNRVVEAVRGFAREHGLAPYEPRSHAGFLRHLVLREGKSTDEMLVNLVTAPGDFPAVEEFGDRVQKAAPGVIGVLWSVNAKKADTAIADEIRWTRGRNHLVERIGRYEYRVSPYAFFQTNSRQTEALYGVVDDLVAQGAGPERPYLVDVCAGAGGIGIYLSGKVERVYGLDISSESIADAWVAARLNGITNAEFFSGDAADVLRDPRLTRLPPERTVVVLDPPRGGLNKKVLMGVFRLRPRAVVYVSCNLHNFLQDAMLFHQTGYPVREVQPVDLFPHSSHLELVALLTNRG